MRLLLLLCTLGLSGTTIAPKPSETKEKIQTSPSVATHPVVVSIFAPPWYDGWVPHFRSAQKLYAYYGITLVPNVYVPIPEYVADPLVVNVLLENVTTKGGISVVYLSGLRGNNGERLAGVFLRTTGGQEIILMDFVSGSTTLAHEIGHYLGLEHTKDPLNVMCDCVRSGSGRLSPEQVSIIKKKLTAPKPDPKSL